MTIGENIKKIRKEKKITQQKLAKEMDISRSYLSDLENNRYNPSSKTLEMLAEKLDVSMLYITSGKKTLKDLSGEEVTKEVMSALVNTPGFNDSLKISLERNLNLKSSLEHKLKELAESELEFIETNYLLNALHFLSNSNEEDIAFLAAFLRTLNNTVETENEKASVSQEETKAFIDDTLKFVREFLEKRFDYKGGE